ncbi:MAG: hypothetical protein KJO69_07755 [Gammaproteobacteria bacterium]|nr:hypothetical protein [Gammaproteobacteria bacterium]
MKIIHDLGEGAHKLGRIFLAGVTVGVLGWVKVSYPEVTETDLLFISAPAMAYIGIKGRGYQQPKKEPTFEEVVGE